MYKCTYLFMSTLVGRSYLLYLLVHSLSVQTRVMVSTIGSVGSIKFKMILIRGKQGIFYIMYIQVYRPQLR